VANGPNIFQMLLVLLSRLAAAMDTSIKFGVNSSSRFSLFTSAIRHAQTDTDATDHPTHASIPATAAWIKRTISTYVSKLGL